MTIGAMKLALEALGNAEAEGNCEYGATALLRAAIEQAEKQEPVAWVCYGVGEKHDLDYQQEDVDALPIGTMLYAAAQREWVGLTDQEIAAVMQGSVEGERMLPYQFARAIEAKLREKNT
jgi:hypothetical protein